MLPSTATRVSEHTPDHINQRIQEKTKSNIKKYSENGADNINRRIEELGHEWDIERVLEANASTIILIGLGLGAFLNSWFYIVPALVAGFLLQHALQGWCPPVTFFRRRGIRTMQEIHGEKYALKLLRGDFEPLCGRKGYNLADPEKAFQIVIE